MTDTAYQRMLKSKQAYLRWELEQVVAKLKDPEPERPLPARLFGLDEWEGVKND